MRFRAFQNFATHMSDNENWGQIYSGTDIAKEVAYPPILR